LKIGDNVLKYKINLISALRDAGYSTYKIKKEKIFTQAQLQHMRENHLLTHDTFDKLCRLLNCQPGDILEYVPDEDDK